jgi:hypothetical protein
MPPPWLSRPAGAAGARVARAQRAVSWARQPEGPGDGDNGVLAVECRTAEPAIIKRSVIRRSSVGSTVQLREQWARRGGEFSFPRRPPWHALTACW